MGTLESRPSRIEHVDGLRAVACLLVVWQHISEVFRSVASGGIWLATIADTVDFGRIGVSAFFAISGFVVPTSIRGPRIPAVLDFIERRFWRLFPPFWVSIPLGIVTVWTLWGKVPTVSLASANVTMLASIWGEPYVMGHYWTLEVELVFYALAALLYLVIGPLRLASGAIALILAALVVYFRTFAGLPNHWPFLGVDLGIMFLGLCCRMLYENWLPAWMQSRNRLGAKLLLLLLILVVLREPGNLLWTGLERHLAGHTRVGWGYTIGVLMFLVWVFVGVRSRALEVIGRGTYSIYLLHPVVFYSVFKLVHLPRFTVLQQQHLAAYLAVLMIASVIVGMLGYRVIEEPADLARKWVSRNRAASLP